MDVDEVAPDLEKFWYGRAKLELESGDSREGDGIAK
jgi:hypothetical protein